MITKVFTTFQFEGFHCWPGAPDAVDFLRDNHRHVFHARVDVAVKHDNRDLEFILLKRELLKQVENMSKQLGHGRSCEMMCKWYVEYLRKNYPECDFVEVSISEDGENGAVVTYSNL